MANPIQNYRPASVDGVAWIITEMYWGELEQLVALLNAHARDDNNFVAAGLLHQWAEIHTEKITIAEEKAAAEKKNADS